jgi:heptosyltransferase-2
LGGPGDKKLCEELKTECNQENIVVLAGSLSFLESAALMKDATMNFTNDSAPLHIASAMDAPTTAVFCSTVPGFWFWSSINKLKSC